MFIFILTRYIFHKNDRPFSIISVELFVELFMFLHSLPLMFKAFFVRYKYMFVSLLGPNTRFTTIMYE